MKRKISVYASLIMTVMLFFAIIAVTVLLPRLLLFYFGPWHDFKMLMTALYISVLPGLVCDVVLFLLLRNIVKGNIFEKRNVTFLRVLSWCCIFVGVEYIVFGSQYLSMWLFSFAALFFGIILRVIKNVFETAVEIRMENDFTI